MTLRLDNQEIDALCELATRADISMDAIALLKRRLDISPESRAGRPNVIIFGDPEAIKAALSWLLGADITEKIRKSNDSVIVVGCSPQSLQPLNANWPYFETDRIKETNLIILRLADRIPEQTLAALESLGTIDLGILVSRYSQPISQGELKLAYILAGVIERIRIAFIGFPSDEPTEKEADELIAYARQKILNTGYSLDRLENSLLWFRNKTPKGLSHEISTPTDMIIFQSVNDGRYRDMILANAIIQHLDNIEERFEKIPIMEMCEVEKLTRQFDRNLDGLGETLRKFVHEKEITKSEQAQTYVIDTLKSWCYGQNLQAETLALAEKFRPGIKIQLSTALNGTVANLLIEPLPKKTRLLESTMESKATIRFLTRYKWARTVSATGIGVLILFVASLVLPILSDVIWISHLTALAVGALSGIGVYLVLEEPWMIGHGNPPRESMNSAVNSPLKGWQVVAQRLKAIFSEHLQNNNDAAIDNLKALRLRIQKYL